MEQIRSELLDLFDGDEAYVDEFLQGVSEKNAMALLRVARSLVVNRSTQSAETEEESVEEVEEDADSVEAEETVEESVEEDTGEAEEEVEANAEVEEEEEVEEETEEAEEEVVNVELGETFVRDLVGSPEFRSILTAAISEEFSKFTAAFEERMRSVEETVEEEREWIQDVPKRTKRAVVSYRPRAEQNEGAGNSQPESYEDIAAATIDNIFGS